MSVVKVEVDINFDDGSVRSFMVTPLQVSNGRRLKRNSPYVTLSLCVCMYVSALNP